MGNHFEFLLSPPPAENILAVDSSDDRFLKICDLYNERAFEAALQECEGAVDEGIYDIRLIGIHLFGVFWRQGPSVTNDAIAALHAFVSNRWEALQPENKRQRNTASAVVSLLENMLQTIQYWKTQGSAEFSAWLQSETPDSLDQMALTLQSLEADLRERLESDRCSEPIARLIQVARQMRASIPAQTVDEPEIEDGVMSEATVEPAQAPEKSAESPIGGTKSPELASLLKKLEAFNALVAKQRFERAAMVADDIQSSVENFDPRKYFPALFAPFYTGLSENFEQISAFWARRESGEWQVLQQLYEVDLDNFVDK